MANKFDLDNLAKATLDCIQGLIIKDDRQVFSLAVAKFYGSPERCEVSMDFVEQKETAK
jgi:Holliday junction resolvase RusA-like endonuclease